MKTFKKVLCVMLSILMAMSCLSATAFAADGESFTSTLRATHSGLTNKKSAKLTLDMIDEALAEANINEEINVIGDVKFTLDLTSINAVCKTLDSYDGLITAVLFLDPFGLVLGDLRNLKLNTWEEGMKRTGDDITILKEVIELIAANKELIKGICDGTIDLGVFADYIDVKTLLGEDGVSGLLKEALIGFVYDKDSAEFTNAYNTYKNDVDAFIYDELLPYFTKDFLPGLELDSSSTINSLLMDVYNISFESYIKEALSGLDYDFATAEYEELRKLDGVVVLDADNFTDTTGLTYDKNGGSVQDQINTILGNYMKRFVPGYKKWDFDGGYASLEANIKGSIDYVAEKSGIVKNADKKTLEEIGIEIALIILNNGDFGGYEEGLEDCKDLQEMATRLLINTTKEMELGIEYTGNESYLVVLGDMLASWAYDNFPIKDTAGKEYHPGDGKDVFEVANYFVNYFLFDRAGAKVLNLSVKESYTIFTKLDKLADFFGKKGKVDFNSKNFLLGTTEKKGLLDCVFTLDIVGLLNLTAIPALNNAGDVSVVKFLYQTVQYFFNNWAGDTLFPNYQKKAFTNALSNENIANMISVLLGTIDSRKASVITLLTYIIALGIEGENTTEYTIDSASVSDAVATGKTIYPKATVTANGKALTQGVDFVVVTDALTPGTATATIKGIGLYSGEIERSLNIKMDKVKGLRYTSTTSSIKLTWDKVPFADSYTVLKYNETSKDYQVFKSGLTGTSCTVKNLDLATGYKFAVRPESAVYAAPEATEITAYTYTKSVKASSIQTSSTDSTVKLSWSKVSGATHYKVEKYESGKWTQLTVTDAKSYTAKKLAGFTEHTFRITAMIKLSNGDYIASEPVKVKAKTTLGTTSSLKASYTDTSITLTWAKVTNAKKYDVQKYADGKWKTIKTVTGTSYKVTGLKAATSYKLAVRALATDNGKTVYGERKSITQYTGLSKPSSVKASSITSTSAKISWGKVSKAETYQVYAYIGGEWVNKGSTKSTSLTIKGLPAGTKTKVKVRAVAKLGGKTTYGEYSGTITVLTTVGKVSSLKASLRKTDSITLSWKKVTGATNYEVYQLVSGKWKKVGTSSGTSFTVKSLKRGTEYSFKVRAVQKISSKSTRYGEYSSQLKAKTTVIGSAKG